MREVMEALLRDVDPDIREVMMKKATVDTKGVTLSEYSQEFANWELFPDPAGFVIDWQRLRYENKDRTESSHA